MSSTVILDGTMIKKSQQKKRTSPCNYKERFFVLDTQELKYSEHRAGRKPILKGCIKLCNIKCVDMVFTDLPIPCDYKYPFQVFHGNHFLYIFAPDNDCRLRWVHALKEETKNNNLVEKYHPQFWMNGKWRCCDQSEKLARGCLPYDPVGYGSKKPLPEIPDSEIEGLSDAVHRIVIALQNYTPFGDTELALQKDKEYTLTDSSHPDWWNVRDEKGNTGFVPRTHLTEISGNNIERFEWYNKNISRGEAENVLFKEGKEGAFVVRNSRQTGVYTVSVFSKAPGSNEEKQPCVKHYQIRQTETAESLFYLAEKYLFRTIPELIHYHQHNAAGLITRLRHPVTQTGGCSQIAGQSQDEREVDPDELTFGQELGSGQFGMVLWGQWREKKVALKMIREDSMSDEDLKEEAKIMMKLYHSKLVQLYGVCTQSSPMCLVLEFMENGCLSDYLRTKKGCLSHDTMLGMCLDVTEGMAYLETSNFIHRDLAARNCLVSKSNVVKLSDFGMTRYVLDDQYTSSMCSKFPVKWSAPEVIKYCKFSSKSDVWSFGVLMWEVYTEGRLPYEHQSNAQVVESLNAGMRLLKPRLAPEAVYLIMEWCWKERPADRPSFALLLHELSSLSER
ncbi:tyrosine-protein kinase ITK/TSK [Corythoichthys intestinalis]|uniref:tyrosine-protein kinase ITK/TSK n=1 Tax=Corythoichthys intestinalis TaxID=161448 RepID=UPI0025A57110|nr:tyrosine-protein kinase ITK/TSK [Corythoichthys intestinalis]XP_061793251.1 tyrosine-protein kinase ITK/TSK-like [Nerophis lumbriciformis]